MRVDRAVISSVFLTCSVTCWWCRWLLNLNEIVICLLATVALRQTHFHSWIILKSDISYPAPEHELRHVCSQCRFTSDVVCLKSPVSWKVSYRVFFCEFVPVSTRGHGVYFRLNIQPSWLLKFVPSCEKMCPNWYLNKLHAKLVRGAYLNCQTSWKPQQSPMGKESWQNGAIWNIQSSIKNLQVKTALMILITEVERLRIDKSEPR